MTVGWLLGLYKNSDRFGELSAKTQKEYASASRSSQEPLWATIGLQCQLDQVDKRSIRSYLDTYPSPWQQPPHCRA